MGHAHARRYPVAVVWSEARIVRQRNATRQKTDKLLMQSVIGSVLSKKGGQVLAKLIKQLDEMD